MTDEPRSPRAARGRDGGAEAPTPWRVEGARPSDPKPGGDRTGRWQAPGGRGFWIFLLVLLAVNWIVSSTLLAPPSRAEVSYTYFRQQVDAGNVAEITSTGDSIDGEFRAPVRPPGETQEEVRRFRTHRPAFAEDDLYAALTRSNVDVNAEPPARPSLLLQLLLGLAPALLLIGLFLWLARRAAGSALGAVGGLGRSRAQRYDPTGGPRVTFDDVAGIDDVED